MGWPALSATPSPPQPPIRAARDTHLLHCTSRVTRLRYHTASELTSNPGVALAPVSAAASKSAEGVIVCIVMNCRRTGKNSRVPDPEGNSW